MRQKNSGIQLLRLIGAYSVFFAHCGYSLFWSGGAAVILFLIISGFCLEVYGQYTDEYTINFGFGLKQIKKIYPFYLLGIIMTIPYYLIGTKLNIESLENILRTLLVDVCLLKPWIPNPHYYFSSCGVMWFVSTIFFCYCCYPMLKNVEKMSSRKIILLVAAVYICQIGIKAGTYILGASWEISDWICYIFPITKSSDFIIGIMLGVLYRRGCFEGKAYKILFWMGLIFYAITNYIKNNNFFKIQDFFGNYFCTIPIIVMLIGATGINMSNKYIKNIVTNMADRTMIIFIFHQTIICYIKRFLKISSRSWELFIILFVCIFYSELIYRIDYYIKGKKKNE